MPLSRLCKAFTCVAVVFAVAFVIVGGILPSVLEGVINKTVKSGVILLSPNDQSSNTEKYAKWTKDENVNIDFYFFNITNKDAALQTGAKLLVKECGPYSFKKINVRFNVTFPSESQVRYYEWTYYVPKYKPGLDPNVDKITLVNLPWLLAVASTAVPVIVSPGIFDQGDNNQVSTLYYGAYATVLGTPAADPFSALAPIFLNSTTSPLLQAVRLMMVPAFMNFLAALTVPSSSYPEFFSTRMNCTTNDDCSSVFNFTMCGTENFCVHQNGTGLDYRGSSFSPAATSFLFNPAKQDYSFSNFLPWSTLLPMFASDPSKFYNTSSWPTSLQTVFTPSEMIAFVTWVGGLINENNAAFLSLCKRINAAGGVNLALWPLNTWSDYGIYQFATGGIVFKSTGSMANRSISNMLPGKFPVGPEPFNINISADYATAKRLLSYTLEGIGQDIFSGIVTPADRRYFFYIVNGFFLPRMYNNNGGLFTTRSVYELLFGYLDATRVQFPGWNGNTTSLEEAWSKNKNSPNIKFTGSDDESLTGAWKVASNQSALSDVRDFPGRFPSCTPSSGLSPTQRFGFAPDCKLWNVTENLVGSRDGTSLPPFKEGSAPSEMRVYVSEAARVVKFLYRGDVTFKGITLHNYTIDQNALLNSTSYPPNSNYFMSKDPDLIIPIVRYWGGADLFLSLPHYLSASPSVFASITAGFDPSFLAPSFDKHLAFIQTEPLTGKTMNVHKRLMLGVKLSAARLSPIEAPPTTLYAEDYYAKLWTNGIASKIYLPTMWVDESGEISDADASSFSDAVYKTRNMARGIQIGFVVFGGLAILVIGIFLCRQSKSSTTA